MYFSTYSSVSFFACLFPTTCHGLSHHNGEYGKKDYLTTSHTHTHKTWIFYHGKSLYFLICSCASFWYDSFQLHVMFWAVTEVNNGKFIGQQLTVLTNTQYQHFYIFESLAYLNFSLRTATFYMLPIRTVATQS